MSVATLVLLSGKMFYQLLFGKKQNGKTNTIVESNWYATVIMSVYFYYLSI